LTKGHDAAESDGADGDAEIARSSCTTRGPTGSGVPAAERRWGSPSSGERTCHPQADRSKATTAPPRKATARTAARMIARPSYTARGPTGNGVPAAERRWGSFKLVTGLARRGHLRVGSRRELNGAGRSPRRQACDVGMGKHANHVRLATQSQCREAVKGGLSGPAWPNPSPIGTGNGGDAKPAGP
jgi:hypothetical protein